MQKFSYHTHTNFSDGENTLEETFEQAIKLGWDSIGISDHMIIHKNMKNSPVYDVLIKSCAHIYNDDFDKCLPIFQKRAEYIRKSAKNYPIKVFVGFEVDYFNYDGWENEFKEFISEVDHDYLINGNHFFFDENCENLINIYKYDEMSSKIKTESYETYLKRHYKVIQQSIKSGLFDILAHLDYARRDDLHQKYPCNQERLGIVDYLKEYNMAIELSTKGLRKIGDFYPENFLLNDIINKNIPIVINDDAHNIRELGYCFDKAEEKLVELGCKNRFVLK